MERIDQQTGEVVELSRMAGGQDKNGSGQTMGDMVSQGMQLLQIRTKSQLMVAVQRPRDLKKWETQLLAMAAEAGEDFFYSIPYKDHRPGCPRGRCDCPSTSVEGPGVGLARTAAAFFGNCAVETRIEAETQDAFLVRSDWVDFETNYTRSETKRVSKLMPRKGGGTRVASGKELDLVYQQGASKVERDVIVRSLPKHIVERAFEMAKAAALQEKAPIAQQIARLTRRLGEVGVSVAQIEAQIGCRFSEGAMKEADKDPRDVCATLRGMLTAIKGGDTTAEEVFGQAQPRRAPASQAPGAIQTEELEPRPPANETHRPDQAPPQKRPDQTTGTPKRNPFARES